MQRKATFKTIILTIFSLGVFSTQASELEIPNTFVDGEVTSASEMNANFEAIKAAVNDNHSQINSSGGSSSRVQLVGFTPTAVNFQGGFLAAKQMCTDFVPNSHICTREDIYDSVITSGVRTAIEGSEFEFAVVLRGPGSLYNCKDFSITTEEIETYGTSYYPYVINKLGVAGDSTDENGVQTLTCSTPLPLACCR